MTLPLIEKHRATTFEEIKGQDSAIAEIKDFFKNFPKKKAIILNGPVGTGKTSLTLALANEYDLELFELNASDIRNKSSLDEILKPATEQQSLFNRGKLILMDEADGITGSDRGGIPEFTKIITQTEFPIVITANDIWQKKFSPLRQKCKIINLKELNETILKELLITILQKEGFKLQSSNLEGSSIKANKNFKSFCGPENPQRFSRETAGVFDKENKSINNETINLIIKKVKGDVRAALNDLESVLTLGEEQFNQEISEREKKEDIFNVLKKVFQAPTDIDMVRIYDNTQMELNEISLWIEENIPLEYKGESLAKAYDCLSKADIFKGRIYRQQYWRFLVYQNFFLSAGISASTKLKYNKFTKYQKPSRILKIWLANQKNIKRKSIETKYAKLTHMSKKKTARESFLIPFILKYINQKTKTQLNLNEKEEQWLEEKRVSLIIANNLNKFRI